MRGVNSYLSKVMNFKVNKIDINFSCGHLYIVLIFKLSFCMVNCGLSLGIVRNCCIMSNVPINKEGFKLRAGLGRTIIHFNIISTYQG